MKGIFFVQQTKYNITMKKLLLSICIVLFFANANAQYITNIAPNSAERGETLTITITGEDCHFNQTSNTVYLFGERQITASSSVAFGANTLSATFDIPADAPFGYYELWIENDIAPLIISSPTFMVSTSSSGSILSVNPDKVNSGKALDITITGSGTAFNQGTNTLGFFKKDEINPAFFINVNSLQVTSAISLLANITVPYFAYGEVYDVAVINSVKGVATKAGALTIDKSTAALTSVVPNVGKMGQTLDVTITGIDCNFNQGSNTIKFFRESPFTPELPKLAVNKVFAKASDTLEANISIPYDAVKTSYNIRVENSMTGMVLYKYNVFTVLDTLVGIKEINAQQYRIYPNPANNYVNIESNNDDELTATLSDIHGKTFASEKLKPENGLAKFRFGETKPAQGIYLLKIESKDGVRVSRVAIE